jgi:hypothetical protein
MKTSAYGEEAAISVMKCQSIIEEIEENQLNNQAKLSDKSEINRK